MERKEEDEEEIVCLDESFFINDNYQLTTFTFGSQVIQLFCLHSASTDFDLTGQLALVLELLGYFAADFAVISSLDYLCYLSQILKKNIELHASPENPNYCAGLVAEKLEWGSSDQINQILHKNSGGFDLVLGADIYILILECFILPLLFFKNIPLLFDTVKQILQIRGKGQCKFILAYVSRVKIMDSLVISEATQRGMQITEVAGTRCVVRNLDGVIFEVTLQ
ncbi:hypothetical protein SLA2020_274570 [Shorea laevis]